MHAGDGGPFPSVRAWLGLPRAADRASGDDRTAREGQAGQDQRLEPDAAEHGHSAACRTYAEKQQKEQAKQMRRLLTLADYEDPYDESRVRGGDARGVR